MLQIMRSNRSVRSLLFVSVCLLVLNILLPRAAESAVVDLSIDDTLEQFTRGNFQRTALGALQVSSDGFKDEEGAVQLAPLGLLKDWTNSPFDLPEPLLGMGTVAIKNRIFVIGGQTFDSGPVSRANVLSGAIDTQTGAVISPGWQDEPPLPPVKALADNDTLFDAVSRPAVASVTRSDGSGYIYVMGGSIQSGLQSFSSLAVHIGVVGTNGRITAWQEGSPIPGQDDNPFNQLGLQDASAASLNINGTNYIYLIGGLQRFEEGGSIVGVPAKKVFYARVDAASGKLFKPGTNEEGWADAGADIPVQGDGLWGAVAVANRFIASNNAYALYLAGGRSDPGAASDTVVNSERVYRATFGNDGKPTWNTTPWQGTMPTSRFGHAGVEFRGNLYLTGGAQGSIDEPDRTVLTSYVQDDLTLPQLGDPGSNFLPNDDALPRPRMLHGSVVIATEQGTAFVYVIGGRGDTRDGDSGDDQGTASVIFGKIGGIDTVDDTTYAPNAWYYSLPYRITLDQAQVRKISWSTLMTQTGGIDMDIALDYRTSTSNDCNNATWTNWQPLDETTDPQHRSRNGRNEVDVGNPAARCFQYRARLSTENPPATPSLLNVNIQVVIPGSPDLKPVDFKDVRGGENNRTLIGLDAFVLNQNEFEETLAADVEAPGDFYVDICISPGVNAQPPTIPLPDSGGCTKVYAKVSKSVMGVNTKYKVREWLDFTNDQPMTSAKFNALFPQVGKYTLYIAVDSTNFVNEGTKGGENNNIAKLELEVFPDPVDPTKPDVDFRDESPGLLLPIIGR